MEKDISKIKKRILVYAKLKGFSKRRVYLDTGISNGVLDKKSGLSEETIEKFISTYKDVNVNWLITGNGKILKESQSYDKLPSVSEPPEVYGNDCKYPLVFPPVIGDLSNADFSISKYGVKDYYVVPKFKDYEIDFMIEVSDSSMYPEYNSGDIVACRHIKGSNFIQWNKVHVIVTREQGVLIKRLKKSEEIDCLIAVSDNKDYAPFLIPKAEIIEIGIVVGVIRLV